MNAKRKAAIGCLALYARKREHSSAIITDWLALQIADLVRAVL